MKTPLLPAFLLLLFAGFSVFLGGLEGAGVLALVGAFLVAFALLLFRRSTKDISTVRNRRAEDDSNFLWMLILSGIALRVSIALLLRALDKNQSVAPDENTFHENAVWFSAWLRGDVNRPFAFKWDGYTTIGYFAVAGTLYNIFGEYPVVPVLLNCVVGGLCAYPAYLVAARVSGRRAGRGAAILLTFFPSIVLWSTLFIRDACVLFFLLWCACLAQSLFHKFKIRTAIWLILCLAALATLRSYLLMLMLGAIVAACIVAAVRKPGRAFLVAMVCGAAALVLVKGGGLGRDYIGEAPLHDLAQRRQFNGIGGEGAVALEGYDLSTPTGALSYLPSGLALFLLSPYPWQYAGRLPAIPELLIWYACIPFVVTGAVFALRRRRRYALVPLASGLFITVLYALVEGNVGIIFRHRAQALVLFLPFAAIGWARRRQNERRRLNRMLADVRIRATPTRRPVAAVA